MKIFLDYSESFAMNQIFCSKYITFTSLKSNSCWWKNQLDKQWANLFVLSVMFVSEQRLNRFMLAAAIFFDLGIVKYTETQLDKIQTMCLKDSKDLILT